MPFNYYGTGYGTTPGYGSNPFGYMNTTPGSWMLPRTPSNTGNQSGGSNTSGQNPNWNPTVPGYNPGFQPLPGQNVPASMLPPGSDPNKGWPGNTAATPPPSNALPLGPGMMQPQSGGAPGNSNDYWSTIHPILGGPIGSQSAPWAQPTNWFGQSAFPSSPPTPPAGKLNYQDWYNQIGKNMAQSASFGSPAASYLDYIGYTGSPGSKTTPTTPNITAPPPTTVNNPINLPGGNNMLSQLMAYFSGNQSPAGGFGQSPAGGFNYSSAYPYGI